MKLIYKGVEYPHKLHVEEGFEAQTVLIPEANGDYILAVIDSSNDYELLDEIPQADVKIENDKQEKQEEITGVCHCGKELYVENVDGKKFITWR